MLKGAFLVFCFELVLSQAPYPERGFRPREPFALPQRNYGVPNNVEPLNFQNGAQGNPAKFLQGLPLRDPARFRVGNVYGAPGNTRTGKTIPESQFPPVLEPTSFTKINGKVDFDSRNSNNPDIDVRGFNNNFEVQQLNVRKLVPVRGNQRQESVNFPQQRNPNYQSPRTVSPTYQTITPDNLNLPQTRPSYAPGRPNQRQESGNNFPQRNPNYQSPISPTYQTITPDNVNLQQTRPNYAPGRPNQRQESGDGDNFQGNFPQRVPNYQSPRPISPTYQTITPDSVNLQQNRPNYETPNFQPSSTSFPINRPNFEETEEENSKYLPPSSTIRPNRLRPTNRPFLEPEGEASNNPEENSTPKVAVANAFAGRLYLLQPNGIAQSLLYRTLPQENLNNQELKNDDQQLANGQILPGGFYSFNLPLYAYGK